MEARPRKTGVICNGGLAADSRGRVGGPRAIVIGYVGGSRVDFEATGGEMPAVAYWHCRSTSDVSIFALFGLTTKANHTAVL